MKSPVLPSHGTPAVQQCFVWVGILIDSVMNEVFDHLLCCRPNVPGFNATTPMMGINRNRDAFRNHLRISLDIISCHISVEIVFLCTLTCKQFIPVQGAFGGKTDRCIKRHSVNVARVKLTPFAPTECERFGYYRQSGFGIRDCPVFSDVVQSLVPVSTM